MPDGELNRLQTAVELAKLYIMTSYIEAALGVPALLFELLFRLPHPLSPLLTILCCLTLYRYARGPPWVTRVLSTINICRFGAGAWLVDRSALPVFDLFGAENIVYLSPDAEQALEDVGDSDVYVVGGIVDRNHSRGLTLAEAQGAHARAVRLPFDEYLPQVSAKDRVLTVVACVGVLMAKHAGGTWKEVLENSLPRRSKVHDGNWRKKRGGAWRGTDGSGWGRQEKDLPVDAAQDAVDVPRKTVNL